MQPDLYSFLLYIDRLEQVIITHLFFIRCYDLYIEFQYLEDSGNPN